MITKTVSLPTRLKNSNLLAVREQLFKLCPSPIQGELLVTLFEDGEYYGYVCQKAAGYHSNWVRVCIENGEDLFQERLVNSFIEHELRVDHQSGRLLVICFDYSCIRVYRSTAPFAQNDSQRIFSDSWNRWQRVERKQLVGVNKNKVRAFNVSIVNQSFIDCPFVIYKAAWTAQGKPAVIEQLARTKLMTKGYTPLSSEGVYLGDGVYIVPEDAWL